jgi:acetyltransferase
MSSNSGFAATPASTPQGVSIRNAASLDAIFSPRSVVVIDTGSSGELAKKVIAGFVNGHFGGPSSAIQAGQNQVAGIASYTRLSEVQGKIDLAVAVASSDEAPAVLRDCVQRGVKGVVLIAPTIGEYGAYSPEAAARMQDIVQGSRTRVLGPGALGVMVPMLGLNATAGLPMPVGGTVALLCESPLVGRLMLDWSIKHIVGLSTFACVGSRLDISWANMIDHFGSDPNTRTIVLQISSIAHPRSLISAAREVSLDKPIIVIKAGLDGSAGRAFTWASRCQSSDSKILAAAFERVGVLQVETIEDLFYAADALSKQPRPRGPRLMVVSNCDGPGVLAADSVLRAGVELATPSQQTRAELERLLPQGDTIEDVAGDGSAENFVAAVKAAMDEPDCDGVLALLVPWSLREPQLAAQMLTEVRSRDKPLLLSYMGEADGTSTRDALVRACIPTFSSSEAAARTFRHMWRYSYDLQALYETPVLHAEGDSGAHDVIQNLIRQARTEGRTSLSAEECWQALEKYGISTRESGATTGVRAKLQSRVDSQFGPVLVFGSADRGPEVCGDEVVGLPPLNATLARRVLEKSGFYRGLLRAHQASSLPALEQVLVRFSYIASEQPLMKAFSVELEIASASDVFAVASQCELYSPEVEQTGVPRPAIRPYPVQYVSSWRMKNGTMVTLRPIRAEDEPLMVKFHESLSDRSVYLRYFQRVKLRTRTSHQRLSRVCFLDYDRELALLAELREQESNPGRIIGVGTLIKSPRKHDGEVAVVINDDFQGQGLGKELVRRLVGFATDEGLQRVVATTLPENLAMAGVFERLGFKVVTDFDEELVMATMELKS